MGARAACIAVLDELLARAQPPTVVIVSHHLDELPRRVTQVAFLKHGRIVRQGAPDALLTSENLSELFDCCVNVFKKDGRFVAGVQ
jgi:iron complex transport system ATP-binding protein